MSRDPHAPILARLSDADNFRGFGLQFLRQGDFGPAILMFRESAASTLAALATSLPDRMAQAVHLEDTARSIREFPGGVNGGTLQALVRLDDLVARVREQRLDDGRTMYERVTSTDAQVAEAALQGLSATLRTHVTRGIQRDRQDWARENAERALAADDTFSPS